VRFNCANYLEVSYRPANCYNCIRRDGYPQDLGGDENCRNYRETELAAKAATGGEVPSE